MKAKRTTREIEQNFKGILDLFRVAETANNSREGLAPDDHIELLYKQAEDAVRATATSYGMDYDAVIDLVNDPEALKRFVNEWGQ